MCLICSFISFCFYQFEIVNAEDAKDILWQIILGRGTPEYIRSDNGSEFIAKTYERPALLTRQAYFPHALPRYILTDFIPTVAAFFKKCLYLDIGSIWTLIRKQLTAHDNSSVPIVLVNNI